MSGTITLPSGDKLITQTEILDSGALVHREEVVISGTISGRIVLPVNSQPEITIYGLPVWEINDPKRVSLSNYGHAGTPLRTDPTGTTTQPVSVVSLPSVSFSAPQPISSVAGTVSVSFPSTQTVAISGSISLPDYSRYSEQLTQSSRLSSLDIDILAVTAAVMGTPAVKFMGAQPITFSGQQPVHGTVVVSSLPPITFASPQTVALSGTISLPDYARYSEQQSQTTSLQLLDDVVHVINATLGKVTAVGAQRNDSSPTIALEGAVAPPRITSQRSLHVNFRNESGQEIGTAGTPLRFDPTGVTTQPVSISAAIPISTVAGTVAVSLPGSVSLANYARYSEQITQTTALNLLDIDIGLVRDAIIGTPAVKFASAQQVSISGVPSVTFSGQQPIHGTVVVSSLPSISVSSLPTVTFASPQPISTVSGTVSVSFPSAQTVSVSGTISLPDYARYSEQQTQTTSLQLIDDVVHATNAALGKIALVGGQRDDASPTLATEDAIVPFRVTSQRAIHNSWRNEAGREVGTSGTPVYIEITGGVTQPISIAAPVSIGAVSGTVNIIPPTTPRNVTVMSAAAGGTVLALLSEQQLQTTALQLIDDSVHAANAAFSKANAFGGQRDDANVTLATEDTISPIRITSYRAQHVSLRNEIGVEVGSAGTPLRFDPTGVTTQPISWTGVPTVSVPGTVSTNIINSLYTEKIAKIDIGATGSTTIVNLVTSKRIKVYAINFQAERAGTISPVWLDGTASLSGTQTYMDREGFTMSVTPPSFIIAPQAGTAVVIHVPATSATFPFGKGGRGWINYWDDDSQ